jgi:hypothetical protein
MWDYHKDIYTTIEHKAREHFPTEIDEYVDWAIIALIESIKDNDDENVLDDNIPINAWVKVRVMNRLSQCKFHEVHIVVERDHMSLSASVADDTIEALRREYPDYMNWSRGCWL